MTQRQIRQRGLVLIASIGGDEKSDSRATWSPYSLPMQAEVNENLALDTATQVYRVSGIGSGGALIQ
jgi:hypothetical protein